VWIPLIRRAIASSCRADGPTCRGVSISSAASSPLPYRLLPCAAAAPPSSCASPTAAWCATTAVEEARGAPGCCVLKSPGLSWLLRRRLPTAPSVEIHRRDGPRGSPSPRPGLHAPPPVALPPWGRRPISLPPATHHRSLPICQSTIAPPHRRRPAAGSFRPERGPCILEGGRVPGHGVREGRPLLSPFDFSLCP